MSIIVSGVNKYYGSQQALKNVSFDIHSGELVGFIGPNGAGKSTMMKIITGFLPQSSGDVKVSGLDIMKDSLAIRKIIGYLPENNPLYPGMYVKEYLKFVAGMYKLKNTGQRIKEVIHSTGLEAEQTKKIGALSKGYRQRVGLAQALVHDPDVLILDEPTTGLDPNQIVEIRSLISETGKEKTIMLSTHIMQEVEAICDRILIINKGEIVADDRTENIYRHSQEKSTTILVEFSEEPDENKLKQVDGVEKVAKPSRNTWLIQSASGRDIRNDLFNFAVKNKIAVLSMQKKEKNLEQVFQELTKE
ncbi:MAG TPA: gliding motility-associated ABC transporter ATP-binding subunit GldA [Bacteroidales bacterium]|nr:gliding motility-associated ABC transporter ATP-binding subunit GldA [Bacteroidales bacterium]